MSKLANYIIDIWLLCTKCMQSMISNMEPELVIFILHVLDKLLYFFLPFYTYRREENE